MNEETKMIMVVGEVREALSKMAKILEADPVITLPKDKLALWHNLEKEYDAFYKLPIEERLVKFGMSKPKERNS